MLHIHDLHTYYGKSYVLQGVTLKVEEGSLAALMGRNGMGKSTLIRSIIGFSPASRGQIVFKGMEISRWPPYQIVRAGIGLVPQGRRIFPSLTVKENLIIAAQDAQTDWNLEKILALFPALGKRITHRGNELSGGELQMLAIGRALIGNPELLLLDEPLEGLSPLLAQEIVLILSQLKGPGFSILLVTPQLSVAERLADRVYIMSKGQIVYESSAKELSQNREIQSRHLGV